MDISMFVASSKQIIIELIGITVFGTLGVVLEKLLLDAKAEIRKLKQSNKFMG